MPNGRHRRGPSGAAVPAQFHAAATCAAGESVTGRTHSGATGTPRSLRRSDGYEWRSLRCAGATGRGIVHGDRHRRPGGLARGTVHLGEYGPLRQHRDNDPWFDVGALLNETCAFEPERREAVEHYAGRFDERLYNRCRLYGAVDDVMGGLWGVTRAVTSARSGIEFYKYGTWRLLHARTTMGARDFESWLRRL